MTALQPADLSCVLLCLGFTLARSSSCKTELLQTLVNNLSIAPHK